MGLEGRRARLVARRQEMGFSQDGLARRLKVNKTTVNRWESGATEPQPAQRRALAKALDVTDAEVRRLLGLPPNELALVREAPARTFDGTPPNDGVEAGATNRREALGGMAVTAATLARRVRAAPIGPSRVDLFQKQTTIADLATRYGRTPHAELLPQVAQEWQSVEELLADGWRSDQYRHGFQVVGGHLTLLLARLAFNMGEFGQAAGFLDLVEAHTEATRDPSLGAGTASMWSGIFYYAGDYRAAAEVAQAGHRWHYSYQEAELHAFEARALGRLGDKSALAVLDRMDRAPRPSDPEPGGNPFTDEFSLLIRGSTLTSLGQSKEAVEYTASSLNEYAQVEHPPYESYAQAYITHAWALKGMDASASAKATMSALSVIDGKPTHTVLFRAEELSAELTAHANTPAAKDLRDRLRGIPATPARGMLGPERQGQ